jgi:hypothetical protein
MQVFVESLGDPIWQIGVGSIALVALVLIVVLRSPDFRLTPWQQWFLPRIIGLVCLSLFLVLSAGPTEDTSRGEQQQSQRCRRHVSSANRQRMEAS